MDASPSWHQRALADWRTWAVLAAVAWPAVDVVLPSDWQIGTFLPKILALAFLALGVNLVTGSTGLLHLGAAAFVAIGAFTFAIATTPTYPLQTGFWVGLVLAMLAGGTAGLVLGLPTTRLRGDYLAIATLGFGEIVVDLLKNLEKITKGTQTIGELPRPWLGAQLPAITSSATAWMWWYWFYLLLLAVTIFVLRNLEHSRIGRAWVAVREDELAARSMGTAVPRVKLGSFVLGSALCAVGGALYACLLGNSSDPSNYDFQMSIMGLCMVILGGMGSIEGVMIGAVVIGGFNVIVIDKVSQWLGTGGPMLASLTNWKYLIFGLVLILMMRYRPDGLIPERRGARP